MGCVLTKSKAQTGGKPALAGDRDPQRPARSGEAEKVGRIVGFGGTSPAPRQSPTSSFLASPVEWPPWLTAVTGDALVGWSPRRADSFQKLSKIGQGTYSNVYKARDVVTGKIVALKKVRFDNHEPESIKFMAREITLLRKLDHPNIIKLEGLVTSRVSCSLYLVFEYMEHDLAGLIASTDIEFSLPQVKCYMKQLLSGLDHCHSQGILHRDIKSSNLLIDNQGILKIADFGLAASFDPARRRPMTSRVVTLWYRAPELLLGATYYGPGVDLWSAGCILGELLSKRPIMPGRTEVEQLHMIFKLCGSPPDSYWKKSKLPHANMFKPQHAYECSIAERFNEFPSSSIALIQTLLSIDPTDRSTAAAALNSEFFTSEPHACEPKSLPCYPPCKEMDLRFKHEESRRKNGGSKRDKSETKRKTNSSIRSSKAVPAPQANAELQINLNRLRLMARANTSKSEKFPPPHQDGSLGFTSDNALSRVPPTFMTSNASFASSVFKPTKELKQTSTARLHSSSVGRKNVRRIKHRIAPSQMMIRSYKQPSPMRGVMDLKNGNGGFQRSKGKELEVFGGGM